MLDRIVLEVDENQCRRLKLDVAVGHNEPRIIGKGLEDESEFPLALLLRGLKIDIFNSDASREEDKKRILNSICEAHPLEQTRDAYGGDAASVEGTCLAYSCEELAHSAQEVYGGVSVAYTPFQV